MDPTRLIPPHLLSHFPQGIAAEGAVPDVRPRTLAIVGSREAVPEALTFTRTLAAEAVSRGFVVVSGGALGIDTAAHEGALEAGGTTWIVSPVPLGEVTPVENKELFARTLSQGGAILTRQLRSTILKSHIFFRRNALLVALAEAVVVVQAGFPSGALNAAKHARELEVPLWAVPSPPWHSPAFAGSNRLIADGAARALWSVEELFSALAAPRRRTPTKGPAQIPLDALRVLGAVDEKAAHLDVIIEKSGLAPGEVSVQLLTLEALGVVREGPPGWFRRPHG